MISRIDACLLCEEVSGQLAVPGGMLIETDLVVGFHLPVLPDASDVYLGYLMVTPKRHNPSFGTLTAEEAADVGRVMQQLTKALEATIAERVYVLVTGHSYPHLHIHVVPRRHGTPKDVSWLESDSWPGARRGSQEEAAELVEQLRSELLNRQE